MFSGHRYSPFDSSSCPGCVTVMESLQPTKDEHPIHVNCATAAHFRTGLCSSGIQHCGVAQIWFDVGQ